MTFVGIVKIISRYQMPPRRTISRLPSYFFMALSALDRPSISTTTKTLLKLHRLILRFSSKRSLRIFKLLSTIYEVSLEKTPDIN